MEPLANGMGLAGRRILVTGASAGIGRAVSILLDLLNATVVLVARDQGRLEATRRMLAGKDHVVSAFDLREQDGISEWMIQVAAGGRLDGLVHCAGTHALKPLNVLTSETVSALFATNVSAALALARGFRQKTVKANDGGSLVLLSSVAALAGQSGISAYAGAKAAILGITRSLAIELVRDRIRVNCVAPGVVRTEMSEGLRRSMTAEQYDRIAALHPLGIGDAEDVARAIAFLLSPAAKWITGTTLVVDGGYTAQ